MRGSKIKINYLLRVLFVNGAYLGEREFGGGGDRYTTCKADIERARFLKRQ